MRRNPVLAAALVIMVVGGLRAADPPPGQWARTSPFTRVEVIGDGATVDYLGRAYELVSIEGLTAAAVLEFCRQRYGDKYEERFGADIADVLAAMGKRAAGGVRLELHGAARGKVIVVEHAVMTRENRDAVVEEMKSRPLDAERMKRTLSRFEQELAGRWSYLGVKGFDHRTMIQGIRKEIDRGITGDRFVLEMQKVVAQGIDCHAGVVDWEKAMKGACAPFLVEPAGRRFVAFRLDRRGFVESGHPYVESIDGKPVAAWIEAATRYVPDGSPQFVTREGLRLLRHVQFMREELGIEQHPDVKLVLVSEDGKERKTVTAPLQGQAPAYGVWPRDGKPPALPAGVVYVRLTAMNSDGVGKLVEAFTAARGAQGMIIDVRDNGGGGREALREVAGRLINANDKPRVVNVAVQRLHPRNGRELMESRFLYPEDWNKWTDAERKTIAEFRKTFKPEWSPEAGKYGPWHYMLLSPAKGDVLRFEGPVVVLMNAKCFSATDVFLSGLKGMKNVTLLGTPSGGGSSSPEKVALGGMTLAARLGTMVSFQADGRMYDTHGVEPDVKVEPAAEFFIGGKDVQLDEALKIARQGRR